MANTIFEPLRLTEDTYNDSGKTDVSHISEANNAAPDIIDNVAINLFYSSSQYGNKNFPLLMMSKGMGNVRKIKSLDGSYQFPVMGKPKTTSTIAYNPYIAGDRPGIGGSTFKLYFKDSFFKKGQTIQTGVNWIPVRIQNDLISTPNGFEATCQITSGDTTAFVPLAELQVNSKFSGGVVTVGHHSSEGNESRSYSPSIVTNRVSFMRETYNWGGNVASKNLRFSVKMDNKVYDSYCEMEIAQNWLDFLAKREVNLWTSRTNMNTGASQLIDQNGGASIFLGSGILEQITNKDSYSILTKNKITSILDMVYFNATDVEFGTNTETTIFTGTLGMRNFDSAMRADLISQGFVVMDSTLQSGIPNAVNQMYGSYFTRFKNIDNRIVNVVHLPFLDKSALANASPTTFQGLPQCSGNMYILDTTKYEGQSNIQHWSEEGREFGMEVFRGINKVPGSLKQNTPMISSKDNSKLEMWVSEGCSILRPTNCLILNHA